MIIELKDPPVQPAGSCCITTIATTLADRALNPSR
jgi:hypothetical protein